MKHPFRTTAAHLCTALLSMTCSSGLWAADTNSVKFDSQIRNNSLALSPDESTAVVSYSERPELLVYDLKKGELRQTLPGYITPRNIVFAPDGKSFYVSDSSLGEIIKTDTATLQVLSRMAAGPGAFGTAISKDGQNLYLNNQASNTVTRFDTHSGLARSVITGFAQPRQGVKLSPDGSKLYVTNFLGDKVTIIDTKTDKIEGEIKDFSKIRAISISADGKTLFAANSGTHTLAVVDIAKREIKNLVAVGREPYGAALSPDGRFIYAGNLADQTVSVVDIATLQVAATITGFKQPRQAIAFTRDGKLAYVLNEDLSIAKVDRDSQKIVQQIVAPQKSASL
ncbi:YncE family protein [Iodobacter sp. HSC-16F04]|uniref:YncE family protein n=1 Tax=Iodobacter violaceini TaxID=3044271 RepID=A0ABX0KZ61_9NEIS|nr:YncE family protein [Iodobacter violacea]NHQ87690.1 YncE family protein [Iodobacter violacea]